MLKEFLNLFRNEDEPTQQVEHPHLEQFAPHDGDATYLEFLLQKVRPSVAERLMDHPDSDPILEVAAGVLLEMFPGRFQLADDALVDRWTPTDELDGQLGGPPSPPGGAPPSPPQPPGAEPSAPPGAGGGAPPEDGAEETKAASPVDDADSASLEIAEEDESVQEVDEVETIDDAEITDEVETDEETDVDDRIDEDDSSDDQIDEQNGDENSEEVDDAMNSEEYDVLEDEPAKGPVVDDGAVHELDELGVSEEKVTDSSPPAGFVSALDDTAEFEMPPSGRVSDKASSEAVALDEPSVLHGARILLAVLLDNDRLPATDQLEVIEILMAAELWARLISGDTDVDQRVKKLAHLVEQKFGTNAFSQARLLLKLFPTNRETRINNDRQLFFEAMISRMGMRDPGAVEEGTDEPFDELVDLELSDDKQVRHGLAGLAEQTGVSMHVYTRRPTEVDRWRALVEERTDRPEMVSYFLDKIPPRRWRDIAPEGKRTVETALREHIVLPMARDYVIGHLQCCYFVLRTVGDTGLEPYLDSFFDWSKQCFNLDATAFLPEIHERITKDRQLIDPVFADVYERYYQESVEEVMSRFDDEALAESFASAMNRVAESDLHAVTAGNFDLGGFVLDAYLEFEYPEPEYAFGMHRLT